MTTRLITSLAALMLISGCTSTATAPTSETPTTPASSTTPQTPSATPTATPTARTANWFDLDVGECLADPPPTDPNVVAVAVVECRKTPHRAEVYQRAPLAVNTAVVDVATRKCDNGFTAYTGEPVGSGRFTVTYLTDYQPEPDGVQPRAQHRHLPAAGPRRRTADGARPQVTYSAGSSSSSGGASTSSDMPWWWGISTAKLCRSSIAPTVLR